MSNLFAPRPAIEQEERNEILIKDARQAGLIIKIVEYRNNRGFYTEARSNKVLVGKFKIDNSMLFGSHAATDKYCEALEKLIAECKEAIEDCGAGD